MSVEPISPQHPSHLALQRPPLLLKLYLAALALATVVLGFMDFHVMNGWILGDWLINYQGGFVRRGLFGEVALRVAQLLHLSSAAPGIGAPTLGAIVLPVLLAFYAVLFYVVWRLLAHSNFNLWVLLYLLSPAALAFPLLDPPEAFHKEELHFAALGILILLLTTSRAPASRIRINDLWLIFYLSVAATVTILSHEGLALYTPYYFAALVIGLGSLKRAMRVAAIPALCCAAAFFSAVRHPGSLAVATQICSSLRSTIVGSNIGICGGAILFLKNDSHLSRVLVQDFIETYGYYSIYPQLLLFASLPIVLAHRALWKYPSCRTHLKILYATMAASGIFTIPLFFYATAWGRWLYIHTLSIFLLLIFIDYRRQLDPATREGVPAWRSLRHTQRRPWLAALALVAIYSLLWDIPGEGFYPARFGVFGLMHYAMHYRLPRPAP